MFQYINDNPVFSMSLTRRTFNVPVAVDWKVIS